MKQVRLCNIISVLPCVSSDSDSVSNRLTANATYLLGAPGSGHQHALNTTDAQVHPKGLHTYHVLVDIAGS